MPLFEFEVGSLPSGDINLFDRLAGQEINLDGRFGPYDSGAPVGDGFTLTLAMAPLKIEPNRAATVTVEGLQRGAPLAGQVVSMTSSNPAVGLVPATVTTSTNGKAVFQIIGLALGSTIISASFLGGISATPQTLTVAEQAAPLDYNASGYGRVTLVIESPLANALTARVQRLSHQEQIRKYPDDTGLRRLSHYETAEIVFLPKALMS